jgi:hypothetical protein
MNTNRFLTSLAGAFLSLALFAPAAEAARLVVRAGPPAARVVVRVPAPAPRVVQVAAPLPPLRGVWVPGHWRVSPAGRVWVPGHWA